MKIVYHTLALVAVMLTTGCANLDRTRNLDNPLVPAVTLAQQVCSNCHGITGNSESPNFPNLAGQSESYVVGQLTDFKNRSRKNPAGSAYMWGLTRSLTDEQINGLASYYAHQQPVMQPAEGRNLRMLAGKAIFENGIPGKNVPACASCHGDQGQGNGAFPRINGQHVDYIVKQLTVFKETNQRPNGAMMKLVTSQLSNDDMENVASYVQGIASIRDQIATVSQSQ